VKKLIKYIDEHKGPIRTSKTCETFLDGQNNGTRNFKGNLRMKNESAGKESKAKRTGTKHSPVTQWPFP
jgi:hypothetical protein